MQAHKIIFSVRSSKEGTPSNTKAYVCLLDEHIYTKCTHQDVFDNGLSNGCFIEHKGYDTQEEVIKEAYKFIDGHALKYKDLGEFIEIEKKGESERVAKAFATANEMIRNN